MVLAAWLVVAVLAGAAAVAAVATRVPTLEAGVRRAVAPLVVVVAVLVVADLGLVLRADAVDRPDSMITHLGYAVAAVGLVPLLVNRRPEADGDEPEPASLWVVAVALLAVAVCVVRLAQTR